MDSSSIGLSLLSFVSFFDAIKFRFLSKKKEMATGKSKKNCLVRMDSLHLV